ncbi:MAG: HNH endonuclease signature motif containing protein [Candidatus Thiodiazotropha endolucinida]
MHWWEFKPNWLPAGHGLEISCHVGETYDIYLHISNAYTLPISIQTLFEKYGTNGCCGQKIDSSLNPCQCGESGVEIDGWKYHWVSMPGISSETMLDVYDATKYEVKKLYDREKDRRRRGREREAEGYHTEDQIEAVWGMQDGRCYYCGESIKPPGAEKPFQKDHIISLYHGGTHWIENIALTCVRCNSLKCAMDVQSFKKELGKIIGDERVASRSKEVTSHHRLKHNLRK